jgi:hypothetical protein
MNGDELRHACEDGHLIKFQNHDFRLKQKPLIRRAESRIFLTDEESRPIWQRTGIS